MYKAVMIHPQVALIKPVLSVFAPTESYTKIKKIPCNFNASADLQGFIVFLHIEQEVHHISVLYDIILAISDSILAQTTITPAPSVFANSRTFLIYSLSSEAASSSETLAAYMTGL